LSGAGAELAARVSAPLGVATAFALSIVLTGAIHVDGFADGCDAFFAHVPVARRLEILKDPRHGTFALAGVVVLCALWLAALASIDAAAYPAMLAIAATAARWGAVVHMLRAQHARREERSPAFVARPPIAALFAGLVVLVALVVEAAPSHRRGPAEALAGAAAATLALAWARTRLDGAVVGDSYGFAIVIGEVAALVAGSAATMIS
jgi:adenosylcobinamide-GDP ribazoletransferase